MSAKVTLYVNGKPACQIRSAQARYLVANNLARSIWRGSVFLLEANGLRSGQEAIYELSAIDKHAEFFQGGLTRTEHQPAIIPKFKAARVGHG